MEYENEYGWIGSLLTPGETVLWKGRPERIRLFEKADVVEIPFSILWLGFAVFWEYGVFRAKAPIFFLAFGAFFVLIGLYFAFGRFIHRSYLMKRTTYAITDKKILRNRNGKTDLLLRSALPSIQLVEYPDGTGTIIFNTSTNDPRRGMPVSADPGFRLRSIPDVRRVMSILQSNDVEF